ncbi:unnamed protein product [Callosobruchus maculatus]|uniref:Orn/DAP/Arg decarboxylase 2 C-terminal domain-containing protein n=1 Tax=Callosobruchus maculatus TaxID=64391 RepID=A0A653D388_CALMS|nr:unnamed protein product [Callosobruchus maculatus]
MSPVKTRKQNSRNLPSIVWGPTCCSNDKISGDVINLPELFVGDWLKIHDTGAYSMSVASHFNGFSLPNVHAFIRKEDVFLDPISIHTKPGPFPLLSSSIR